MSIMFQLRKCSGLVSMCSRVTSPKQLFSARLFSTTGYIQQQQGKQNKETIDIVVDSLKNTSSSSSSSQEQKKQPLTFSFNTLNMKKNNNNRNDPLGGASKSQARRSNSTAFPTAQMIKKSVEEYHLTGPRAGRTVQVRNGDMGNATRQLNRLMSEGKISQTFMDQRYYIRPSKQKLLKKVRRKKREFSLAFGDLLRTVQEIKRKGY